MDKGAGRPRFAPGRRRRRQTADVQKKDFENFRLRFHLGSLSTHNISSSSTHLCYFFIIIFIISVTSNQFLHRRCIRDGELSRRSASPSRTSPCLCDQPRNE